MLSKLPADRFTTAAELAAALRAAPPRRWLRFQLRWVLLALLIIGLFVTGIMLGMALSSSKGSPQPRAQVIDEPGVLTFDGAAASLHQSSRFCLAHLRRGFDRQESGTSSS